MTPAMTPTRQHLPPHSVSVFIPLCALTASNGPTEFQLSTHIKANLTRPPTHADARCPLGSVAIYDIRRGAPLLVKDHQYGLPIRDIKYHRGHVVSADAKIIKLWEAASGKVFTNIQPAADINDVAVCADSGMLFLCSNPTPNPTPTPNQVSHAHQRLGYTPRTSIDVGLRKFIRWYRSDQFRPEFAEEGEWRK